MKQMSGTPKKTRTSWKPGQSGNPKGRPVDPQRKEAIEILKAVSPELMELAIKKIKSKKGNDYLHALLLKKILPDNLNLGGSQVSEGLAAVAAAILKEREEKGLS
jgi:Family of unknown function (DUF5681)